MNEREIHPWDLLPADYAGLTITFIGLAIALRAAVIGDAWLMVAAAGVCAIGTVLKVSSTRYKGRLDRARAARQREGADRPD